MPTPEIQAANILIVDDERTNTLLLERLLEQSGFSRIQSVTDARLVFDLFDMFAPDILLLDIQMPYLDGFAIMKGLTGRMPAEDYFPILVLTADTTVQTKRQALAAGAKDFLTKPFDVLEVVLPVKNLLHTRFLHSQLVLHNQHLEARVYERTRDLEEAQVEILARLGLVTEYRDDHTGAHTRRVGELAARVARALGMSAEEAEMIQLAAPLHDLGKIAIPDAILLKPGKLLPDEFGVMQQHAHIGAQILSGSRSRLLQLAEEIALAHHERWDGTGYPQGLAGEAIPLSGRIIAVVDVFDALSNRRPYKEPWPVHQVEEEIRRLSGRQFDPRVVDAFLSVLAADHSMHMCSVAA